LNSWDAHHTEVGEWFSHLSDTQVNTGSSPVFSTTPQWVSGLANGLIYRETQVRFLPVVHYGPEVERGDTPDLQSEESGSTPDRSTKNIPR
jgi:hypothetical protein